jgi:hypothetical protein
MPGSISGWSDTSDRAPGRLTFGFFHPSVGAAIRWPPIHVHRLSREPPSKPDTSSYGLSTFANP